MIDAKLNNKKIDTSTIKNYIVSGQTGVDGICFLLANNIYGVNVANPSMDWFITYRNNIGEVRSVPLIPSYEESLVKLPWIPDSDATQIAGHMEIQLTGEIVNEETMLIVMRWVSEPAVIYVMENVSPEPIIGL